MKKVKQLLLSLGVMFTLALGVNAQTLTLQGSYTPDIDRWNTYTAFVTHGADIDDYEWVSFNITGVTFDYDYERIDHHSFRIKPLEEGSAVLWCNIEDLDGNLGEEEVYKEVESEAYVYVPSVPNLDGATTVSVNDVESYLCTPSSGDDYEWIIPFGCQVISGSDYQKSIVFYTGAGQTRLIKVRYKSNGVWSAWGTISVYVDYN